MRQPTEKEIEEAKAYVRLRVEREAAVASAVDRIMGEYVLKLISLAWYYGSVTMDFSFSSDKDMESDARAMMKLMTGDILDAIEYYASDTHSDRKREISDYIGRYFSGKNLYSRTSDYSMKLLKELGLFLVAATALGYDRKRTETEVLKSLRDIRHSATVTKAKELAKASVALNRNNSLLNRGTGKSEGSMNALEKTAMFAVAEGWMYYDMMDMQKGGALGYYIMRGSSFDCGTCDAATGLHSFSEGMILPMHSHCKCFAVPAYEF